MANEQTSRWRFFPRSRNARAICERVESLITEIRLAELRSAETAIRTSNLNTDMILAAIKREKQHESE
jgi:hypothetical protein